MTKLTIKTGTEDDFFKRGRQLARAADRGEQLLDERIVSFEDPADERAGGVEDLGAQGPKIFIAIVE